jgi:hypothetical protein
MIHVRMARPAGCQRSIKGMFELISIFPRARNCGLGSSIESVYGSSLHEITLH